MSGSAEPTANDAVAVPEAGPFVCAHCGRPFAREAYLALHYGVDHDEPLDAERRAAFETAREEEEAALRQFRLKALLALVFTYFGFLMLWAVVNLLL
ncbi:C2H2-type zinc finger protein [Halomarina oriensis]|uniref:C2H2-type zinc finger protein n=1 Tax=Halomarina oriensis TaxID=671145 RepID=A0A6B0GNV4_9EURY|nr:C2H2-type zinc finger protein [Halomarina oriensis]MWG33278.1 C2H2-type zinc finger protein [Halomarina oriensis]